MSDVLFGPSVRELPADAVSLFEKGWVHKSLQLTLSLQLLAAEKEREVRWLYGREITVPRATCHYGVGFDAASGYRKLARCRQPFSGPIAEVKAALERASGFAFNGCLVNFYEAGGDKVAWHHDDEPHAVPGMAIGSVSLGAYRRFDLRPRPSNGQVPVAQLPTGGPWSVMLGAGDLLVMAPGCQDRYQHQVPPDPSVTDLRINLTFRQYDFPDPDRSA